MFWFDELSVKITRFRQSKINLDSIIREGACKLNLIVFEAALLTVEGGDDDFPEERDFGHENGSFPITLALNTQALNDDGLWVFFDVNKQNGLFRFLHWINSEKEQKEIVLIWIAFLILAIIMS